VAFKTSVRDMIAPRSKRVARADCHILPQKFGERADF